MIPLYPFQDRKEKIRLFSHFRVEGSILTLNFFVDDSHDELEDFYPLTIGENDTKVCPSEDLWKSTCFEIFLKNRESADYYEFNFNSKGDWNLFYFSNYRERHKNLENVVDVSLVIEKNLNRTILIYRFDLKKLEHLKIPCQINISSVIKTKAEISYWSQKHNGTKPDFHDPENFSLKMNYSEGKKSHG